MSIVSQLAKVLGTRPWFDVMLMAGWFLLCHASGLAYFSGKRALPWLCGVLTLIVPAILFFSNKGIASFGAALVCYSIAASAFASARLRVGVVVRGRTVREAPGYPDARGFTFSGARVLTEKAGTVVHLRSTEVGSAGGDFYARYIVAAPVVDAEWTSAQPVCVWVGATATDEPPALSPHCMGGMSEGKLKHRGDYFAAARKAAAAHGLSIDPEALLIEAGDP